MTPYCTNGAGETHPAARAAGLADDYQGRAHTNFSKAEIEGQEGTPHTFNSAWKCYLMPIALRVFRRRNLPVQSLRKLIGTVTPMLRTW